MLATVLWNVAVAPSGGSWNTASNWVGGVLPGADDDVEIDLTSPGAVTTSSSVSIHSLTADVDTTLAISGGAFTLAADSTLSGGLALSAGTVSGGGVNFRF